MALYMVDFLNRSVEFLDCQYLDKQLIPAAVQDQAQYEEQNQLMEIVFVLLSFSETKAMTNSS